MTVYLVFFLVLATGAYILFRRDPLLDDLEEFIRSSEAERDAVLDDIERQCDEIVERARGVDHEQ